MSKRRRLPPVWLMGLTNATFGMMGGFAVVTLPEMLAAQGVPGGRIAAVTAAVISPGFWVFAISPMLDVRLSRRSYALITALCTAAAVGFTVIHHSNLAQVEAVMMAGYVAASLYQGAVGGWMGSLISKDQDGQLGVWFAVANLGTGGLMMLAAGELLRSVQPLTAALILGVALLLPTLVFLALPAPAPDRRLARESFGRFWADVFSLATRHDVQIALVLFLLPSASFALTNVLGGIGKDFGASERMVSLFAGVGSALAGVVGSLLVAPLARRFPLRPLYLGIGIAGAMFTLILLLLPRHPWTFALAITGENLFQALAFAAANGITFETIGPANPLASTTFTVLIAASNLSITYMSFADGWGYTRGGITGSFATDAGVSLLICAVLLWVLRRWRHAPSETESA